MATISIDIDVEDYLDKVDEEDLIDELENRGIYLNPSNSEPKYVERSDFADDRATREFLFEFMDIKPWKGKWELIAAIDQLFEL